MTDTTEERLDDYCKRIGLKMKVEYIGLISDGLFSKKHYKCRLGFKGRTLTTDFYQGMGCTEEPVIPDVISSLCLDASAGMEDFPFFCSSFGYDTDSMKANKLWKACKATVPKLKRFLGDAFNETCEKGSTW
jgi:hypothetical protein